MPRRNHNFEVLYTVTLKGPSLHTSVEVLNTNTDDEFDFTAALHTYIGVAGA